MNRQTGLITAVVLVLLIGGGLVLARGNTQPAPSTAGTDGTAMQSQVPAASPTVGPTGISGATGTSGATGISDSNVRTIDIETGSFYFKPSTLEVKKGQRVKVVIHSVSMMHDFFIDELNVRSPIVKSGDTGEVEFTPDRTGTFEYYCSVGQHRQMGQVGKITVTE